MEINLLYTWLKLGINSINILVHNIGGDYMNDIVNIISMVGFPISSCLLYMYYIYKDKNQTREENLKREDNLI